MFRKVCLLFVGFIVYVSVDRFSWYMGILGCTNKRCIWSEEDCSRGILLLMLLYVDPLKWIGLGFQSIGSDFLRIIYEQFCRHNVWLKQLVQEWEALYKVLWRGSSQAEYSLQWLIWSYRCGGSQNKNYNLCLSAEMLI